MLHIWCFFGDEKGKPWSAISFWRGLGLLGRLLKVDMELRELRKFHETEGQRVERRDHIRRLLVSYCKQSCVVGNQAVDGGKLEKPKTNDVAFTPFDLDTNKNLEKQLDILVDGLMEWLDEFDPETKRIDPIYPARMREIERKAIKEKAVTRVIHSLKDEEGLIIQHMRQIWKAETRTVKESKPFRSIKNTLRTIENLLENTDPNSFKLEKLKDATTRILKKLDEIGQKIIEEILGEENLNKVIDQIKKARASEDQDQTQEEQKKEIVINFTRLEQALKEGASELSQENSNHLEKLFRECNLIRTTITGLHKRQKRLFEQIVQQKTPLDEDEEFSAKIRSMAQDDPQEREKIYKLRLQVLDWESCYTRRIHGETVLGDFWKHIESAYFEKHLDEWNAHDILCHWLRVLMDFFDCGRKYKEPDAKKDQNFTSLESTKREPKVITLLASCPFVAPFAREESDDTIKRPVFLDKEWGADAKRVFKGLGVGDIDFFEDFREKPEKDKE
jgi:hypothetical protein